MPSFFYFAGYSNQPCLPVYNSIDCCPSSTTRSGCIVWYKKNYKVQDVAERAKTCQQNIRVLHVSACRNAHNNKENKSTCTCLTKAHTTKVIQRKSWRENEASSSSRRVWNSLKHAFLRTAQRLTPQWEQWQKVSYLWRYTLHTSLRGSADSISVAIPIEKIIIIIMNFTLVI